MWFELILVVAVLPLVALGLSLGWHTRNAFRRDEEDAEVEAAGFVVRRER